MKRFGLLALAIFIGIASAASILAVISRQIIVETSFRYSTYEKSKYLLGSFFQGQHVLRDKISSVLIDTNESKTLSPHALSGLRRQLVAEYESLKPLIATQYPTATERDAFWIYLTMRVGKSMPVFKPRPMVNLNLYDILADPVGNCSDHALRLAITATLFDAEAYFTPIKTKSMPGHVFVDLYDRNSQIGYILDSNFGVVMKLNGASGASFMEKIVKQFAGGEPVEKLRRSVTVFKVPTFIEYAAQGDALDPNSAFNAAALRMHYSVETPSMHLRAIFEETDEIVSWWNNSYPMQPRRGVWHLLSFIEVQELPPKNVTVGKSKPVWNDVGIHALDPRDIEFFEAIGDSLNNRRN